MEESAELKDAILLEDAVLHVQEKRDISRKSSKNWKRIVRRKAERFSVLNGELMYGKKNKQLGKLTALLCSVFFFVFLTSTKCSLSLR